MEVAVLMSLALPAGFAVARTLPILLMVPAFGGVHLTASLRMAISLLLGLLAMPRLMGVVFPVDAPVVLVLMLVREVGVGMTLGFVASLLFHAAESAGRFIDIVRGANMSEVLSPISGQRSSPMGTLYLLLSTMVFLELGGLSRMATAVSHSYEVVPLWPIGVSGHEGAALMLYLIKLTAGMLESAIGLCAPVIVSLLLVDVALGLVARVAPQLQVYFLGLPIKALGGIGVVLISLGALHLALREGVAATWSAIGQTLQLMR
jgi:flagellar biosynthesis protein FliR